MIQAAGTGEPCIFRSVLEQYGGNPMSDEADEIKGLAVDVYGGECAQMST